MHNLEGERDKVLQQDKGMERINREKERQALRAKLCRFVLLRGCSGFYSYAIYEHVGSPDWPAFSLGETRIAFKLRKDKFNFMAVSDDRKRFMPLPDDRLPGRGQPLAYPEAVLFVNPVEPMLRGEVMTSTSTRVITRILESTGGYP